MRLSVLFLIIQSDVTRNDIMFWNMACSAGHNKEETNCLIQSS